MNSSDLDQLGRTLRERSRDYDVELSENDLSKLEQYYQLLQRWNDRLHLVAPCSPAEFATRHLLESLLAVRHLDANPAIADIGSGGGLPIIPLLIAAPTSHASLIEASKKKAVFLQEAVRVSELGDRSEVVAKRFENVPLLQVNAVTCRALERFIELLPKIVAWAPASAKLLLFGGIDLQKQIEEEKLDFKAEKIPHSERRFLFIIDQRR